MSKKNITAVATAAILVMAMAAMAVAGPGYGRGMGRYMGPNNGYTQLTPEKQAAVDAIYEKYDAKFTELRNQMWTKQSTLQALVNGGQADEKKIASLTADISELRDQMRDTRDQMFAELEKETGLTAFGGRGYGRGYGRGGCSGGACDGFQGRGQGRGFGPGNCPGYGQGWN